MKVILRQDQQNLGKAGEAVNVKDGYAMNYLIPNQIAVRATASNLRTLEELKKQKARKTMKETEDARKLADLLGTTDLTLKAKAGDDDKLFGSISAQIISDALNEKGFTIDKKHINLHEPIKHTGTFTVEVKLTNDVSAQLTVQVEKE